MSLGVLRRVSEDTPRPLRMHSPEVPGWLAEIVAKLLSKEPAGRFQTAAEVADLLGRCLVHLEQTPDAPPPFREEARLPASRGPARRWGAVATALLLAIGLGAAEAGGVTGISRFVATVLRIKTSDGVLVVAVDDPEVKVRVDGEELTITGAGPQEFHYRPGRHQVVATRGGSPVLEEEVTITRGGKRLVTVTREGSNTNAEAPAILPDVRGWVEATVRGTRLPAPSALAPRPRPEKSAPALPPIGAVLNALRPVPASCTDPVPPWPFGVVSTAAYSPDGKQLALGCGDGSVTLSDTATRRLRAVLGPHPGRVWSLAFSPDGKTLASAGGDWDRAARIGFVSLWDVATGRQLSSPGGAGELELAVAFSPDGGTLAWAGRGHTVTLWDVAEGRTRATCAGHEGPVRAIAFHPGGGRLVSAGFDGTIRFWDANTGEEDGAPIRLAGKSSNCVAVSPDGKALASNTGPRSDGPGWGDPSPGLLQLWDWETRRERLALKGHRYHILGVAFSPDGKTLASAGGHFADGAEVKLWDVATGRERLGLSGHGWWVECVAFSPDAKALVSGAGYEMQHGEVRVWDLSSGEKPRNE